MENGLNHNSVNCFLNSSDGLLWIGTFDGINIYDGYSMVSHRFNLKDTNTLSNGFIECLFEDRYGNIWVGTQNGLNRYLPEKEGFVHYLPDATNSNSLPHNVIKDILQDHSGNLWIATYGGGLCRYNYDSDNFSRIETENAITQPHFLNDLFEDSQGIIWIGTWLEGLFKFDSVKSTFQQFLHPDNNLDPNKINTINCILEKQKNVLWLGTWEEGIRIFDSRTNKFGTPSFNGNDVQELKRSIVKKMVVLNNREVLVGTFNNGLFYLQTEQSNILQCNNFTYQFYDNSSLSGNSIWSLNIDRAGVCWIATWGDGVSKIDFDKNRFKTFNAAPHLPYGLKHSSVSAVVQLYGDRFIIGTFDGGLYNFNRKSGHFQSIETRATFQKGRGITRMAKDPSGLVWVGTRAGLYQYDPKNNAIQKYTTDATGRTLSGDEISALFVDAKHNVWVGARGAGIDRLVPVEENKRKYIIKRYWDNEHDAQSLSSNTVTDFFQDHNGVLWVSMLQGGINIYNPDTDNFSILPLMDSDKEIGTSDALTVFESLSGQIWIGTLSNGLWSYDRQLATFRSVAKEDGLANNAVYDILEDANGILWLALGNAICRYNPVSGKARNFFRKDGLHTNDFNIDIYSASIMTTNRELVFGGKNGLSFFDPTTIVDNAFVPQVIIHKLLINGQPVSLGDTVNRRILLEKPLRLLSQLNLTRHEQIVSFEFASLHFATPSNIQYEYMLEGFDQTWIPTTADRRFATYTNLPPGNYTFKVRGTNSDGIWSPKSVAQLKLKVSPPFWRTSWFITFLIFLFTLIGYLFYKSRTRYMVIELTLREKLNEAQQIIFEKQIFQLEQDKLNTDLDQKKKELASNTIFITQKNQQLKKLKDYLTDIIPHISDQGKSSLNKLKVLMDDDLDIKENWDSYEKSFDVLHDDFMKRFTKEFSKITHKDLRMVSYIRMNYSNKEIADMLNISLRSVESSRYRLRKKMDLPSDFSLNDFIVRY